MRGLIQRCVVAVLQVSGGQTLSPAEYESKRREFEAWLVVQNQLLSELQSTKAETLSPKELKMRRDQLQVRASHPASFCLRCIYFSLYII